MLPELQYSSVIFISYSNQTTTNSHLSLDQFTEHLSANGPPGAAKRQTCVSAKGCHLERRRTNDKIIQQPSPSDNLCQ